MKPVLLVLVSLLAACWLFPAGGLVWAQTPKERSSGATRNELADRWNRLPASRKEELRQRYEAFKKLSPRQQNVLRKRHEELHLLRLKMSEESKDNLKEMPRDERKRLLNRRVREELGRLKNELENNQLFQGPPLPGGGPGSLPPAKLRQALRARNENLLNQLIEQMLAEGSLTPEELGSVQNRSYEDRVLWVLQRLKKRFLFRYESSSPSPAAADDLRRYRDMPVRRFHSEVRRHQKAVFDCLSGLTPRQRKALNKLAGKDREERVRQLFKQNFRTRLIDLGVEGQRIDFLLRLPQAERFHDLLQILWSVSPEKMPVPLRKALRQGPPPPPGSRFAPKDSRKRPGPNRAGPKGHRPARVPTSPPRRPPEESLSPRDRDSDRRAREGQRSPSRPPLTPGETRI